ncbi:hypothetical protein SHIRM173S_01137 [Streptomyces hirsutus]
MIRTWTSENVACSNIRRTARRGSLPEASSADRAQGEGHGERDDRSGHCEEHALLVELLHQRASSSCNTRGVGRGALGVGPGVLPCAGRGLGGLFVFEVSGGGTGHGGTELLRGDGGGVGVRDEPAVVDHPEGVGQADQLVQVGGDQQDGEALAARLPDVVPDRGLRADVHTAGGVGGDQEAGPAADLTADDQLLLVASGQGGGGDVDAGGAHVVLLDDAPGVLRAAFGLQPEALGVGLLGDVAEDAVFPEGVLPGAGRGGGGPRGCTQCPPRGVCGWPSRDLLVGQPYDAGSRRAAAR